MRDFILVLIIVLLALIAYGVVQNNQILRMSEEYKAYIYNEQMPNTSIDDLNNDLKNK